jgi:hypothetical protein
VDGERVGSWLVALGCPWLYANNQQPTTNNQWIGLVGKIDSAETIRFYHCSSWGFPAFRLQFFRSQSIEPNIRLLPHHCTVGWGGL